MSELGKSDVSLLFDVEGGSSISSGSGKQIYDQLSAIVSQINSKPFAIKFEVDKGSVSGVRSAAQEIAKTVDSAGANGKSGTTSRIKTLVEGTKEYGNALTAISTLQSRIIKETESWNAASAGEFRESYDALIQQGLALDALESKLKRGELTNEEFARSFADIKGKAADAAEMIKRAGEDNAMLVHGMVEHNLAMNNVSKAIDDVTVKERDWSKAKSGRSKDDYNNLTNYKNQLIALRDQLDNSTISQKQFNEEFKRITGNIAVSSARIKAAGENTKSFGDKVKDLASKFTSWLSVSQIIMRVIQTLKQMVQTSIELDTAFTKLKIITGATDDEMRRFSNTAVELSKNLGRSIKDVTESIETFSRLGYSLEESSKLSEYAGILSNVANVEADDATKGLTAIIKGYNMSVDQAEHVADLLVSVGQKYAVSASEMMEAYEKSGSALSATNTSIEKSAGLIAAANASIQNASTVGKCVPSSAVMCCKQRTISVKAQRWVRPRKDNTLWFAVWVR